MSKQEQRTSPYERGLMLTLFPAIVHSNKDPKGLFRIQAICPAIARDALDWATPFGMPHGTKEGLFVLPAKGDNISIMLVDGDAARPMWTYGAVAKSEAPTVEQGKISLLSKDGAKVALGEKVKIANNAASLATLIDTLFTTLTGAQYTDSITSAPVVMNPASIAQFNALKAQFKQLLDV